MIVEPVTGAQTCPFCYCLVGDYYATEHAATHGQDEGTS